MLVDRALDTLKIYGEKAIGRVAGLARVLPMVPYPLTTSVLLAAFLAVAYWAYFPPPPSPFLKTKITASSVLGVGMGPTKLLVGGEVWHAAQPIPYPVTLTLEFSSPAIVRGIKLMSQDRHPLRTPNLFDVQGLAKDGKWVLVAKIDDRHGDNNRVWRSYAWPAPPPVSKLKLVIQGNAGRDVLSLRALLLDATWIN